MREFVIKKIERIEKCKKLFGNKYNHEYDEYLCVQDNGKLIRPNYYSKRFKKIIEKHNLPEIRLHDIRHSIATILRMNNIQLADIRIFLRSFEYRKYKTICSCKYNINIFYYQFTKYSKR